MEILVKIQRYNPPKDSKPYYQKYEIPYKEGMTILDILIYIRENLDSSLAFRYECRKITCGNCGVLLNNKAVLACGTMVDKKNHIIIIKPLLNFPVIKDLVVDFNPAIERLKKIKPYLAKGKLRLKTKEQAEESRSFRSCIECWLCVSVPQLPLETTNMDPVGIVKLARFETDRRDKIDRKKIANDHKIKNYTNKLTHHCSRICPQKIDITEAVKKLK